MLQKAAVVRVLVFVLAWLNQLLVSKGYSPLPVIDEETVSAVITFVVSVWVLFTDNKMKKENKTK